MAGAELFFADGLNCLIGGRGAGKTTALEFLRFGLGLMPDPKLDGPRHRAIEGLVKANLGSGRVTVDIRTKAGMLYTADRAAHEVVQVRNELGGAVPILLDRDQVFSADVFSQNEIEDIAQDPAAQLDLLDRFRESDSVRLDRDLAQLARDLEQGTSDLLKLDKEIADLSGKSSEVAAIEEKLKGLADAAGPDAARINAAHQGRATRASEERYPQLVVEGMKRSARDVAAVEATFRAAVGSQGASRTVDSPNADTIAAIAKEAESFGARLVSLADALTRAASEGEREIESQQRRLAEQHAVQEAEYRVLLTQIEEEGGRAAERMSLQTALADAQAAAREMGEKKRQTAAVLVQRTAQLARLSELRDERFALRQSVAAELNRDVPGLRVTVTQAAELGEYQERLAGMLKGAGVQQNVAAERLSEVYLPTELARIVRSREHEALREAGYEGDRARRIMDALEASGAAYALELVELPDRPRIELRDGEIFKESSHLSTGQRCTTILPILLIQNERPLLIDQPEDNLDNAFVFETIVKALKAVKNSRQVIFVTHNPNIPVLGEASRVFVFDSDGEHARVRRVGTVDECKEDIEQILEGGREAFLQRKARYGH